MHNKVQIFGLQRSGTNFMEWSLLNNFKDVDYKNFYLPSKIPGYIRFNENQVLKHHYPTLEYSDYAFVVYKDWKDWTESMIRYRKRDFIKRDIYNEYLKIARALPSDKTLVYEHSYIMKNYKKVLKEMSEKFDLELVDNITIPKK